MANAKQMRMATQRKALRPKTATSSPSKTKVHHNVIRGGYSAASSMVFLNPKTKVGREYYVEFLPREGWVFNRGHARSTYHFHNIRAAAMTEMEEYAERHEIKYKPGKI
jgi:hypothetical protein